MNTIEDELAGAIRNSGRTIPNKDLTGAPGPNGPDRFAQPNIRELKQAEQTVAAGDLVGNGESAAKYIRENAATAAHRIMMIADAFAEKVRRDAEEVGSLIRADADRRAERVLELGKTQQSMSDELAKAARKLLELKG